MKRGKIKWMKMRNKIGRKKGLLAMTCWKQAVQYLQCSDSTSMNTKYGKLSHKQCNGEVLYCRP
jgi:hypothetical protein